MVKVSICKQKRSITIYGGIKMSISFSEFKKKYKGLSVNEIEIKNIHEAGNVSSSLVLKKHNEAFKHGRDVLKIKVRDRDLNDKLDALARQIDAVSSVSAIAAALSGSEDSFLSKVAQGSSLRRI